MTVIFSRARGHISSYVDPGVPARLSVSMENWGGYLGFKSIITRVVISSRGNYQVLHSLGGQVFIYTFGERVGSVQMSGVSMDATCEDQTGFLGIERVLRWYNANRIAVRATPMRMLIGAGTALQLYMVGFNCDVTDPIQRVWQYNAEFLLVPADEQDSGNNDRGSSFAAEDTGPAPTPVPVAVAAAPTPAAVFPPVPSIPDGDGYGYVGSGGTPESYPLPATSGYTLPHTGPKIITTGWK